MKLYFIICVLLGVLFGIASSLTGINPISLVLGTTGLIVMIACVVAPLFIDMDQAH